VDIRKSPFHVRGCQRGNASTATSEVAARQV
jgi:hypothetical protein